MTIETKTQVSNKVIIPLVFVALGIGLVIFGIYSNYDIEQKYPNAHGPLKSYAKDLSDFEITIGISTVFIGSVIVSVWKYRPELEDVKDKGEKN